MFKKIGVNKKRIDLGFWRSMTGPSTDSGIPRALWAALETAAASDQLIPVEVAKLQESIDAVRANPDYYENPEEEIEELEYKQDLVKWQLEYISTEAKRRIELIKSLDTKVKRVLEVEKCKKDIFYWFDNWAWTQDPRPDSPVSIIPFKLFDFQRDFVQWITDLVFKWRQPGLADKSRDMGGTWAILGFIVYHWLFDQRFEALVGSRKKEFVDMRGRSDTLFERIRSMIRMLPEWMLPEGFDIKHDMREMNIVNPFTGSYIAGEASTESFGRQGRYTMIFLDEFAMWPDGGFAASTSCSQSSRTQLYLSTPKGKLNKFAKLRWDKKIRVHSLHWKRCKHPWKDDRWYRSEARRMDSAEIAQELDIDYEASQVGLVFPQLSPIHTYITWSEFADFYKEIARDKDGNIIVPVHWLIACMLDWGSTDEHRTVVTWAACPGESDKLADTAFFIKQLVPPIGATPDEVAEAIIEIEKELGWTERVIMRKMSHEAKSERDTFDRKGLDFEAWETNYTAGIAQIRNYLRVIDKDKLNPFRPGTIENPIKGRSRLAVLVDNYNRPLYDKSSNKWYVTDPRPGRDEDFFRARIEIQVYHIPASEIGKPAKLQRPMKAFDDAMDTWRAHGNEFFVPLAEDDAKTKRQKLIEEMMPERLKLAGIDQNALSQEEYAMLLLSREYEAAHVEIEEGGHWRDSLFKKKNVNTI